MGGDKTIKTYQPSIPMLSQGDRDVDLDKPEKSPTPSSGGDQFKKENPYELWGYDTRKLIGILPIAAPLAYFVNKGGSSSEKKTSGEPSKSYQDGINKENATQKTDREKYLKDRGIDPSKFEG